jgi:hypothetical protein
MGGGSSIRAALRTRKAILTCKHDGFAFLVRKSFLIVAWSFIKSLEMFMGALVRSTHFCAMIRITFR